MKLIFGFYFLNLFTVLATEYPVTVNSVTELCSIFNLSFHLFFFYYEE